jgi:methylenetetrahydrofolate/methylenetetrahydromethanopterin dehydrogenase (NADP+)
MSKPKILVCLDSDPQSSVFDAVVAVDAGVDHLFRHSGVTPGDVRDLVHGAMFTRGTDDLKNSAVFIGGSDVNVGEQLLNAVTECFFGPMRVSVLLDSSGSNTTAAAAVVAASRHLELAEATVAVLAGTGSVGKRVMRMLASEGSQIRLASRRKQHAEEVAATIDGARITPYSQSELEAILDGADAVISCGPPGIELLPEPVRTAAASLKVAIDLNAVPPLGIAGIEVTDKAVERSGCTCYGAIGVGGTKMKIHRAAIERLYESNDAVLDADQIYDLAKELAS